MRKSSNTSLFSLGFASVSVSVYDRRKSILLQDVMIDVVCMKQNKTNSKKSRKLRNALNSDE